MEYGYHIQYTRLDSSSVKTRNSEISVLYSIFYEKSNISIFNLQ
jgi:hypothetical protein